MQADLTGWTPPEDHFQLVTTHYVHATEPGQALFRRLAAAVAPGGTLLIVTHQLGDSAEGTSHAPPPEVSFTVGQVASALDPDRWEITTAETRTRTATDHDGRERIMDDAVLSARKVAIAAR